MAALATVQHPTCEKEQKLASPSFHACIIDICTLVDSDQCAHIKQNNIPIKGMHLFGCLAITVQTRIVRESDYSPAAAFFHAVKRPNTKDNEWKRNPDINKGPLLCHKYAKNDRYQSQPRSSQYECIYNIRRNSVN